MTRANGSVASNDGSLQQWAADGPYNRPTSRISQAHMMGSETSSIEISRDFHTVITRGGDDTLKGMLGAVEQLFLLRISNVC